MVDEAKEVSMMKPDEYAEIITEENPNFEACYQQLHGITDENGWRACSQDTKLICERLDKIIKLLESTHNNATNNGDKDK